MFERFTDQARQVLLFAHDEAQALAHDHIGTDHILLGLLREEKGLAAPLLQSLGLTPERVRAQVVLIVGSGKEATPGEIPFTTRVSNLLVVAQQESVALGHDYVGTEHLLLALVREQEGVAARILVDCDVDLAKLRDEVIVRAGGSRLHQIDALTSNGPDPAIDPGWLDGLPVLLKVVGEEIRTDLGRAPDVGDLLIALVCVPGTPAAEALDGLQIDIDELWGRIEYARTRSRSVQDQLATRMAEIVVAKESAIDTGRFREAAALRDQERELRQEALVARRDDLETIGELRRRLGITRQSEAH